MGWWFGFGAPLFGDSALGWWFLWLDFGFSSLTSRLLLVCVYVLLWFEWNACGVYLLRAEFCLMFVGCADLCIPALGLGVWLVLVAVDLLLVLVCAGLDSVVD